jgi:membrane protein
MMRNVLSTLQQALERFLTHDGWAIASHLALSVLMSLFPFLIFMTALSSLSGAANLSDEVAKLLFEVWPSEVADPIAREVRQVLTIARTDALTLGAVLSLYFASSGVEAVRVGLNRAYDVVEARAWWRTRLESIVFIILGAIALISFAFLVVLGPLGWRLLSRWMPAISSFSGIAAFFRIAVASLLVVVTLILAHRFLPAREARGRSIWPGIAFTILLWLACGYAFGLYLDSFAGSYVSTYAGLATAMILLVFMYILAAVFLLGVEINGVLALSYEANRVLPPSQPPNASSTSS